jgi:hypothetical protein
MIVQFETMKSEGDWSFVFLPMIALTREDGITEFGVAWLFWLFTLKTE